MGVPNIYIAEFIENYMYSEKLKEIKIPIYLTIGNLGGNPPIK
jgi:hypothetical protein